MEKQRAFGRNSHIPACLECRARKAKCSKTQPCGHCVRHGRNCTYASKIERTPLTREHLTSVESRLRIFETALGKLFPDGDLTSLAQDLLLADTSVNDAASPYDLAGLENAIRHDPGPVSGSSLLTDDEQAQFVDTYFTQYHVLCPLLNKAAFRRGLLNLSLSSQFQLLLHIVLAIGAWLTAHPRDGLETQLFQQAKDQFQSMPISEHADISVVQALVLLSDFAQKQGSAGESDHYIGTALRIAMTLNLHKEPAPSLGEVDQEIRRRVWWSVYCAESCSAKMYGRPLLLPDDNLITVHPVSNIHDVDLVASPNGLLPRTDSPTIYTGLIQQSSYHRMANRIYHRLLSSPAITQQDVSEAEQEINAWHRDSFCGASRPGAVDRSALPEWYLTARRRQTLCDQSLRLLIHRPLLLQWLRGPSALGPGLDEDSAGAARCRADGLRIARTTVAMIAELLSAGRCSRLTLAFTLYTLFHALIVPLIHVKKDPLSPVSISLMQDFARAEAAVERLPVQGDALAAHFVVVLRRLFTVASLVNSAGEEGSNVAGRSVTAYDAQGVANGGRNDIFGKQELALLEAGELDPSVGLDFSQWVDL